MTTPIYKLTNGTDGVNLLGLLEGVEAREWSQAVAQYKNGGTFRQSSLADGRRLVDKHFDTIVEDIPILTVKGGTQDLTIAILHKLFDLFEQASDYWVKDWSNTPVWIESRAACETNTRYALVVTASIPNLDQLYAPGAFSNEGAPLANMQLIIEHEHWTANQPGVGTAVEISNQETYDGRTLGRTATTTNEVFVASRRNDANITDIYTWSAANGFSANLMDAGLPFDLIDDVGVAPQVNDLIYFGIDSTLANSGTFSSLIFDIGVAQVGLTLVWEFWDPFGPAWVPFPAAFLIDNTNTGGQALDTTGVNSVVFTGGATIDTIAINGITAFWVRLRVTAVGALTTPTQQTRKIYAVTWPYVDLSSEQVAGNIPALATLKLYSQTDSTTTLDALRRVIVGLRTVSRGTDFTAYLNCADEQNPANVTVAITGADTIFAPQALSPTYRAVQFHPLANAVMASRFTVTISAPLTAHFYGDFHGFLRVHQASAIGSFTIQMATTVSSGGSSQTSAQTVAGIIRSRVVDLGAIRLPLSSLKQSEIVDEIVFDIQVAYTGTGDFLYFYDLILMPADEWVCDTFDFVLSGDSNAETGEQLLIDSISYPKTPIRTHIVDVSTGYIKTVWGAVKSGPAILQRNSDQRLWFTCFNTDAISPTWQSDYVMSIQVEKQQRYLGPRGTI